MRSELSSSFDPRFSRSTKTFSPESVARLISPAAPNDVRQDLARLAQQRNMRERAQRGRFEVDFDQLGPSLQREARQPCRGKNQRGGAAAQKNLAGPCRLKCSFHGSSRQCLTEPD